MVGLIEVPTGTIASVLHIHVYIAALRGII